MRTRRSIPSVGLLLIVFVVVGSVVNASTGQVARPTDPNLHAYLNERLYRGPATLIAQGTNTTPIPSKAFTGLYLTTYEIREVNLPQLATWENLVPGANGELELRPITFARAWRVTVKGEAFIVGSNVWTMVADDSLLGMAVETEEGLTTIVYDRSLLREGSRLGVSYAGGLQYLSEAIHWPGGQ
jgi:hypothetical protein